MSLIVETGSGSTTAESYISVAEADTYHAANGAPASWTAASTADKESALRQATAYLDDRYAYQWRGTRAHEEQALRWPRTAVYDDDGFYVSSSSIPERLGRAVAVVALALIDGTELYANQTNGGEVVEKSVTVGSIAITKVFAGSQSSQPTFPEARALLAGLIDPPGARLRG